MVMTNQDTGGSTREALLDAAERIFADKGVRGASLREITRVAGANVASIHYHFGSKEDLVREVISRRLEPLNRRRLDLLDAFLSAEPAPRARLRGILTAFIDPVLEMRWADESASKHFARLMGRAITDPMEDLQQVLHEAFAEVFERFLGALADTLPDLSPPELLHRFHFMVGSMAHCCVGRHIIDSKMPGQPEASDPATLAPRLIRFLEAGFRAPAEEAPDA
jgi:AcrR family transcriptional regulator